MLALEFLTTSSILPEVDGFFRVRDLDPSSAIFVVQFWDESRGVIG